MENGDGGKLNEILELVEENHRMLRKLYRSYWWQKVWSFIYWAVIIALVFGAYYYIQPYIEQLGVVYTGLKSQLDTVKNAADTVKSVF